MTDLSKTIEPKSDQLNADDLIAGAMTLHITGVKVLSGDQPVNIEYEGMEGRPYKPCKSMRRLMITAWGSDGDKYVGRKITVYNDDKVRWAGTEVGGIRISHMSDIEKELRVMLTESRGRKSPHTVKVIQTKPMKELTDSEFAEYELDISAASEMPELQAIGDKIKNAGYDANGSKRLKKIYSARMKELREKGEQ